MLALNPLFLSRSRSASQTAGGYAYGSQEGWEEEEEGAEGNTAGVSQESEVGVEQGDEELLLPSAPVLVNCQEDDEFQAALDKMINDNITESKSIVREKGSLNALTAPVSVTKGKKTWEQLQDEGKEEGSEEDKVPVMIMLRKGGGSNTGKVSKEISVSANSQLGEQFLARDQREAR